MFSAGAAARLVELYPDEYLFDGGDTGLPVHYDDFHRLGLESSDAVAEYTDHLGVPRVKPTNRVAIYSPRFAAVRTISTPTEGIAVDTAVAARETIFRGDLRSRIGAAHHNERLSADGIHVRSRASGLDSEALPAGVGQATVLALHDKLINVYQNLAFLRTGRLLQTEEAYLAYGIQAALVWTRDQFPVIAATTDGAHEIEAEFRGQELVGLKIEKTKGRLRIVKLADRQVAAPGEIVTFTIRYDNLGDLPLHHVRIIDNLTPRLEYVDDSATSDRAGRLDVEPNGEGSLVLKFIVDDPLPGHSGGVVTFQARVR